MSIEERELRVRSDLEVLEAKLEETVGSSAEAEQARAAADVDHARRRAELRLQLAHLEVTTIHVLRAMARLAISLVAPGLKTG